MSEYIQIIIGLIVPLIGTTLGAAMVFFLKKEMSPIVEKSLLGVASGVMIAASVWSLIMPAIELSEKAGGNAWLPAAVGFLLGVVFLMFLDYIIPKLRIRLTNGKRIKLKKNTMLVFAVTLHNIPEGMAVGVAFAGVLNGLNTIPLASAMALSIGIAIQNFPEGAIISMPLKSEKSISKSKAFLYGFLSGIVEPISAVITILLTSLIIPVLPYILAFAAGAMIYVVVSELIPESQIGEHKNVGKIGVAVGFVLMMALDVAFG